MWDSKDHTSVDAVQPSGNIQPLGLDPWMMAGYRESEQMLDITYDRHTSMVKQWPGSIMPGSSFTEANRNLALVIKTLQRRNVH